MPPNVSGIKCIWHNARNEVAVSEVLVNMARCSAHH